MGEWAAGVSYAVRGGRDGEKSVQVICVTPIALSLQKFLVRG